MLGAISSSRKDVAADGMKLFCGPCRNLAAFVAPKVADRNHPAQFFSRAASNIDRAEILLVARVGVFLHRAIKPAVCTMVST